MRKREAADIPSRQVTPKSPLGPGQDVLVVEGVGNRALPGCDAVGFRTFAGRLHISLLRKILARFDPASAQLLVVTRLGRHNSGAANKRLCRYSATRCASIVKRSREHAA